MIAPITDARFTFIASLLPSAKALYSATKANISMINFNIIALISFSYAEGVQMVPGFMIPNSTYIIQLQTTTSNRSIQATTTENSIKFNVTPHGGLIAVLD